MILGDAFPVTVSNRSRTQSRAVSDDHAGGNVSLMTKSTSNSSAGRKGRIAVPAA
jgi:hypothetical protein